MLSKNRNHLARFDVLLRNLPPGCIFDGEIAVIDEAGRPQFRALMFGRWTPVYVAFDVLYANGEDLRPKPLRARKAVLKRLLADRPGLLVMDGIAGRGTRLFQAVYDLDLEGVVAKPKRMADPYAPETKWFKIPNRDYSQKVGRGELFQQRYTLRRSAAVERLPRVVARRLLRLNRFSKSIPSLYVGNPTVWLGWTYIGVRRTAGWRSLTGWGVRHVISRRVANLRRPTAPI